MDVTILASFHEVTIYKTETIVLSCITQDFDFGFFCIVAAAVPMVEAMVALVLVDQLLAQYAQCHLFPINPELQEPLRTASPVEFEQPQNAAAL